MSTLRRRLFSSLIFYKKRALSIGQYLIAGAVATRAIVFEDALYDWLEREGERLRDTDAKVEAES